MQELSTIREKGEPDDRLGTAGKRARDA